MTSIVPDDDFTDLLGPEPQPYRPEPFKPRLVRLSERRPFQNWTGEDIADQPELGFLIGDARRPILGESSLWQIYGKKKAAKTLFTMEASFCIAFGIPFFGLPTKQGQVVYVIAEGGIKRNYARLVALYLKHRVAMEKLGYTSLEDAREKTGNMIIIDRPIALVSNKEKDPFGANAFLADMKLQGVTNPVLIVLDTWARMLWASGGHDSSQEHVGPSLQACDMIRQKLGGCTLAAIAHVGKTGTEAKGLTDFVNAVDGALSCEKDGNTFTSSIFKFTTINIRHGEEGFQIVAKLMLPDGSPDDGSVALDGDDAAVTSIALAKATRTTRLWLDALRSAGKPVVTMTEWISAAKDAKIVNVGAGNESDSYGRAMRRAREELVKLSAISVSDDKVTLTLERAEATGDFEVGGENDFGVGDDEDT
jgi:hypothetical protein